MNSTWLAGLLRRRGLRIASAAAGVAVAVALLASLGAFLAASRATMTDRAVRAVTVDWQVQVQPGTDPATVLATARATPGIRASLPVQFAGTSGLATTTGTSTQTTGAGIVLGLPEGYRATFPGVIRTLAGADTGVLLAQQTAATLHATPGDTVAIGRAGLPEVPVRVEGIVALPEADSLFQKISAPAGSQPPAPPDNVLILPQQQWHTVFDPLAATHPDQLSTQIHAARTHQLPADPATAYTTVTAAARNLEARTAGGAVVGDNLAATLDKARSDAAYAGVLFVFLGLPGAALAGLLTAAVTTAGAPRRHREQALLRARGAHSVQLVRLAGIEAATIGVLGSAAGLAAAALIGWVAFGSARFGTTTTGGWTAAAAAAGAGLAIAAATVLGPAYRDLRSATVAAARRSIGHLGAPAWTRYGLDAALLAAAGIVFWLSGRNGYQLVLAPEGVPGIAVSYWAFAGPALLWAGAGLLAWRLTDLLLGRGRRLIGAWLGPLAGNLAPTAAAMIARQRRPLTRAIVLLGLALAFAVSTATFNATYQAQAELDAQLTNGADVTVTPAPGAAVGPAAATPLTRVAGVRAVEPIQHRFAYVGADLQDLYGVNPATITRATTVVDQFFQGGTAHQLLGRLAAQPDAILVSAETVKDFQLQPGDLLNLRLPEARTHHLTTVAFHYVGIVTEFPTAPKDSFLVANASYLAARTGSDTVGAFLIDTGGQHSSDVAARLRSQLGPTVTVTDVAATRGQIGSSLTAVDLAGLTRVELGFALVLAAAAGGLVLALGLAERRRSFAIATALGARSPHLRSLVTSEATLVSLGGLLAGAATGWALSQMLVAVLTGVFDPPPAALTVPWPYLAAVVAVTLAALTAGALAVTRYVQRPALTLLRDL